VRRFFLWRRLAIVPEIKILLIIILVSFIAMVFFTAIKKINRYSKIQENLNPEPELIEMQPILQDKM
jgi:hypothetical protein